MITIIYLALAVLFAKGLIELTLGVIQMLVGIVQLILAVLIDVWEGLTKPYKT